MAAIVAVSAVLIEKFLPVDNGRGQPTVPALGSSRAAAAAIAVAREDSQSDRAWQESLGELNSRIDRLEGEHHAFAPSPDPVIAEIAAIQQRLDALSAPLPENP